MNVWSLLGLMVLAIVVGGFLLVVAGFCVAELARIIKERGKYARLYAAVARERESSSQQREQIDIRVISEGDYASWLETRQRRCAQTQESADGFDGLSDSALPQYHLICVPYDSTIEEARLRVVDELYDQIVERNKHSLRIRLLARYAAGSKKPWFLPAIDILFPVARDAYWDSERTLREIGVVSGDIAIYAGHAYKLRMRTVSLRRELPGIERLREIDIVDFFNSVITETPGRCANGFLDCHSIPGPDTPLGALLLYTEEDRELAEYVRRHYSALNLMSGLYVALYFFEDIPPARGDLRARMRAYWMKKLPSAVHDIMSAIGYTRSKPYPNDEMYCIAGQLNIPYDRIPCLVFFSRWSDVRRDRIVLDVSGSLSEFFRKTLANAKSAVEAVRSSSEAFSLDSFRRHLPDWWNDRRWEEPVQPDVVKRHEYDVALSFAGEDRAWAQQIADSLKERKVKVFYDKHEEALLWGKDLYEYLADVYQNKAMYCILILSRAYVEKRWTAHERRHAQARAFQESEEYILPVRIDDVRVPGLAATVGYLDLRRDSVASIVDAVLEKLRQRTRARQE